MYILRRLSVPTGDILIVEGEKGKLECLSLGDYGKEVNIKANFLGLSRELEKVEHTKMLSLEDKWVITISTQYGCSMNCPYCDVPKVGPGINATFNDLVNQVKLSLSLHPEIKRTNRLNIHFARMGEPSWNPNVLKAARSFPTWMSHRLHPVVSTIMPRKNTWLEHFIEQWLDIKNRLYSGNAGLQLSINSTNEQERVKAFGGNACTLEEIGYIMKNKIPLGRKITLNFAIANYTINPTILLEHFSPKYYIIKLTPMHLTSTALLNQIKTTGDYTTYMPYKNVEEKLKNAGYDVLVFIASVEEDLGRITCGNAILSGTSPQVPYIERSRSGRSAP
jgi:23S rRNA (adenine2503-C2)-methyltransferase